MNKRTTTIQPATANDLNIINEIITESVMSWPLPERIKRLSLKVLLYDEIDLEHYDFYLISLSNEVAGMVAWDKKYPNSLIHGLFIKPHHQKSGLGKELLCFIFKKAGQLEHDAVFVKAERISCSYFEHLGFETMPPKAETDYPYLFKKTL